MAIPAFFKIASEVSKAKNVAEGDVSSVLLPKDIKKLKKFDPNKRIDINNTEPIIKEDAQEFDPDKRLKTSNEVDLEDKPPIEFDNPSDIDIHELMDHPGVLDDLRDVQVNDLAVDEFTDGSYTKLEDRFEHAEHSKDSWSGEPGKSEFTPDDPKARIENVMNKEDISEQQQKYIKEFEENHEKYTDDSQAKGNYGEMKVDQVLNNKGLKNLSENRVSDLKTPTGQGIDGVYYDEAKGITYNVEVKYGTSQLGDTLDGKQMSSEWIDNRLDQAVGKEMADKIRMDSITNPDSVKSVLAKVDADGNISYFELDANANIIGGISL